MATTPPPLDKPAGQRFSMPAWLGRAISIGIVSTDPEVVRRQRLTNVATYAMMSNQASHLVTNALHDLEGMLIIHGYNALMIVLEVFIHRLHRRGPNHGAIALITLIILGNIFVAAMMGRDSDLHVYFTIAGAAMFPLGVENWRQWVPFVGAAAVGLLLAMFVFPPGGLIVPGDLVIRRSLSDQAMVNTFVMNLVVIFYALTVLRRTQAELQVALGRADHLLAILLPAPIADRLKADPGAPIADRLDEATILFADLVGFTEAAHDLPPDAVVAWLDRLVRIWDRLCGECGVEKIKTIGDSYMVAAGIAGDGSGGAARMARFALNMMAAQGAVPPLGGRNLGLRIGIHSGSATAGVIGEARMGYDLWGDAVNIASRMESTGIAGRIHVSDAFRTAAGEDFVFEARGAVEAKGIGAVTTWFLTGVRD